MPVNISDALKSQKKGLKLDVTRMGYTRVYTGNKKNERVSVWSIDETAGRLCAVETICGTRPVGREIGKSLRGS